MKKLLLLLLPLLLLSCNNISSSSSDGHNPDEIYDYVPEEIVKEAYSIAEITTIIPTFAFLSTSPSHPT